jgi:hypothetical protein
MGTAQNEHLSARLLPLHHIDGAVGIGARDIREIVAEHLGLGHTRAGTQLIRLLDIHEIFAGDPSDRERGQEADRCGNDLFIHRCPSFT